MLTKCDIDLGTNRIIVYGSSGNDVFDHSVFQLLQTTDEFLYRSDFLDKLEPIVGTVPGSEYAKRILGRVLVVGRDPQPPVSKLQHVRLKNVAEHPHTEGEWYRIPKNGRRGRLLLDNVDAYDLTPSHFYFVPFNKPHALSGYDGEDVDVLVYKFSHELSESFTAQERLMLELNR